MCWRQHGGSGLGFGLSEVLDLPLDEFEWFLARIAEQREKEARALEKTIEPWDLKHGPGLCFYRAGCCIQQDDVVGQEFPATR